MDIKHAGHHRPPADRHGLERTASTRRSSRTCACPVEQPRRRGEPRLVRRHDAARLRALEHRRRRRRAPHDRAAASTTSRTRRGRGASRARRAADASATRSPTATSRPRCMFQLLVPHHLDAGPRPGPELRGLDRRSCSTRSSRSASRARARRCSACTRTSGTERRRTRRCRRAFTRDYVALGAVDDRRRHVGDPAQHHRDARPRPAARLAARSGHGREKARRPSGLLRVQAP